MLFFSPVFITIICLLCNVDYSSAVPTGKADTPIEVERNIETSEEDETYMKKCIVKGNAYSHGETILSYDPNMHCLCVASEVYCWWQNYKEERESSDYTTSSSSLSRIKNNKTQSAVERTYIEKNYISEEVNEVEPSRESKQTDFRAKDSKNPVASPPKPRAICYLMGKEYREGEVLPHSTGNCIVCSCGSEGRVECSPRDCIPLRAGLPPYKDILDISETSSSSDGEFEIFDLARDRGIDESF
ncbi:uncharacterized protein [Prorops nasuta]|uniref:uncharacterized protein n=1 Tax=Prorops nasuta TaxID=863751 RepID=UPI0034CF3D3C